jgi:hypothetical protein
MMTTWAYRGNRVRLPEILRPVLKYSMDVHIGRVQRFEVKDTWLDEVECVNIIDGCTHTRKADIGVVLTPRILPAGRLAGFRDALQGW